MIGCAASVEMFDSRVAPMNAPTMPGMPSLATVRRSTLPNFQWLTPAASVVPTCAKFTAKLACAAVAPPIRAMVVAVIP